MASNQSSGVIPGHAGSDKWTVGLARKDGSTTKLAKIIYDKDGSYFVLCPYHPFRGMAQLDKATINYALYEQVLSDKDRLDVAISHESKNAIKLSHHPSGWVHFSGGGITSGPNPGSMGLQSFPLTKPVAGPTFALTFNGLNGYETLKGGKKKPFWLAAVQEERLPPPVTSDMVLTGFYFPYVAKESIIQNQSGLSVLCFMRPADGVPITALILPPPPSYPKLGFLGVSFECIEPMPNRIDGFCITTPTGNLRHNEHGQVLADSLFLHYPRTAQDARVIDYKQQNQS